MTATALFPLAPWLEGTNQNSTSANDNALRIEALMAPAEGFAAAVPSAPVDHDQWLVSVTWGGFAVGNVVIYLGGTWREFTTYDGMTKVIAGKQYIKASGAWSLSPIEWVSVPASAIAAGEAGQVAYDSTHLYVCAATNTWVRCALATW